MNETVTQAPRSEGVKQLKKNAHFCWIIIRLRYLLKNDVITKTEYTNAKVYYQKLTRANLIIID